MIFHAASAIDEASVAQVQASLRRRILRAFVGRGLLQSFEAKDMLGYQHSGFSVDTSVRTKAHDRAGLGRLLRYCARPPFACGAAAQSGQCAGVALLPKQHSEPGGDKRADQRRVNNPGAKADELTLTPLELIDRIAALVPPPRTHRQIRDHIGVQSEPPRLSPARGPPMWEECDALILAPYLCSWG